MGRLWNSRRDCVFDVFQYPCRKVNGQKKICATLCAFFLIGVIIGDLPGCGGTLGKFLSATMFFMRLFWF